MAARFHAVVLCTETAKGHTLALTHGTLVEADRDPETRETADTFAVIGQA